MKLENLIRKGRKGIATLGLAGLTAAGAGGCATTIKELSEGEATTLLGAMMSASDDSLAIKLAPYVSLLGQMKYQKEVIREGRTQVNVNIPENVIRQNEKYSPKQGYDWVSSEDPNDLRVKEIFGSGFAFRWVDYNQSGNADNWDEYVERKNRFRQDESIVLALLYEAEEPFRQNLKIYSPEGRIVGDLDVDPFQKKVIVKSYWNFNILAGNEGKEFVETMRVDTLRWSEEWGKNGLTLGLTKDKIDLLLKHFGEGEYSAVWRVNGKIMDSIIFDIIY